MPYIDKEIRERVIEDLTPVSPGELNFLISHIITNNVEKHTLYYQTINDIVGALEGAKLEFYRRVAVPYENTKMAINGDVYTKE